MTQITGDDARPKAGPMVSASYRNLVLVFLLLAYTFNFIDRTIVSTINQAIKLDLKLSDTQLGLLGGPAFAFLYTILGVPIARVAERRSRVWIITISLVVWSGFTFVCGLATSFIQLLALRVGVGIGEAGCSPPAHSLISDYFEPKRRASALAVYAYGIPLGTMIGAAFGGWLAKTFGWRVAFMAVGAPGLILALAFILLVREPKRGMSDPPEKIPLAGEVSPRADIASEIRDLVVVGSRLFGRWPVMNMILGLTLTSFAGYGGGAFSGPYFIRAFGLDYATAGLILGLGVGFSGGLGTLAGGFVSDWASRHDARWYALTPAIGIAIAAPIYFAAYLQLDWRMAALLTMIPGVFVYTYLGPTFAVVQNVVETRQRATAAALLLLFVNFIALGGGPLFTGWIIDQFARFNLGHPQAHHILQGLAGIFGPDHTQPAFSVACPGGLAPAGAGPEMAAKCKTALVSGTREGMLVTMGFIVWGSLHYFLASIGLARQLSEASEARKAREA